ERVAGDVLGEQLLVGAARAGRVPRVARCGAPRGGCRPMRRGAVLCVGDWCRHGPSPFPWCASSVAVTLRSAPAIVMSVTAGRSKWWSAQPVMGPRCAYPGARAPAPGSPTQPLLTSGYGLRGATCSLRSIATTSTPPRCTAWRGAGLVHAVLALPAAHDAHFAEGGAAVGLTQLGDPDQQLLHRLGARHVL